MFEIEQMEKQFDYSLVDNDTADFLRSCEYEINGIAEDARVKFGKVLVKARKKLASHNGGVFQKWYESGGLDRNNVYYYMDLYESSRNLENSQRENFLKAPKTVQKKVMQKNTPEKMKEAVLSGEVTTNKEFEALKKQYEQQLKQRDELIASREQENEILQSKLEDAENKEPDVIERYTDPEDYQETKNMNKHLLKENEYYKNLTENLKNEMNNFNKAEEPIRNTPQDQTEIIIEMLRNIENFINDDSYNFDIKKIKSVANNIFEGME